MVLLRAFLLILAAAFAALIGLAIVNGSFTEAGAWLMSDPWGRVTLADLYLGFVLSALVIWWMERSTLSALIWIVPLPFLGNVWTAVWFVIRLPALRDRLTRR